MSMRTRPLPLAGLGGWRRCWDRAPRAAEAPFVSSAAGGSQVERDEPARTDGGGEASGEASSSGSGRPSQDELRDPSRASPWRGAGPEEDWAELDRAYAPGRLRPLRVPFGCSEGEAVARLGAHQRSGRWGWLAPSNPLLGKGALIHPIYVPFWCFDVRVESSEVGRGGWGGDRGGGGADTRARASEAPPATSRHAYPFGHPATRVPATYAFRWDYAEQVFPSAFGAAAVELSEGDARRREAEAPGSRSGAGPGGGEPGGSGGPTVRPPSAAPLDAPDVRPSVAWEFALRAIRAAERERLRPDEGPAEGGGGGGGGPGAEPLRASEGAEEGGRRAAAPVRTAVLSRRARLVFAPVYAASYTWGEAFNVHGERVPDRFLALVDGSTAGAPPGGAGGRESGPARGPGVACERHMSSVRAFAAGAVGFGAMAALWETTPVGPTLAALWHLVFPQHGLAPPGHDAASALLEGSFAALCAGSTAAVAARLAPVLARARAEAAVDQAEAARLAGEDGEPADAPGAPGAGGSELDAIAAEERAVRDLEWARWVGSRPREWERARRRGWASALASAQGRRMAERRLAARLVRERASRAEAERRRAERKRARWGPGSFREGPDPHQGDEGGWRRWDGGAGAPGHSRPHAARADHLGLYRSLDLPPLPRPSDAEVKRAFRRAALLWHPDRAAARSGGAAGAARPGGSGPADDAADHPVSRVEASRRFHAARRAYEVLRDPRLRKQYDAGRTPAHDDGTPAC